MLLSIMGVVLKEGFDYYFDYRLFSSLRIFGKQFWRERSELVGKEHLEYLCSLTKDNLMNVLKEFKYYMLYFSPNLEKPIIQQLFSFFQKGIVGDMRLKFDLLLSLLSKFAIVPPDSAECERIFSLVNVVKDNLRSQLSQENLNACVRIIHFFHRLPSSFLLLNI